MEDSWIIDIQSCKLIVINDNRNLFIRLNILGKEESLIAEKGYVHFDEMPKIWYEIVGVSKIGIDENMKRSDIKSFCLYMANFLFVLTNDNPLVWQCSKNHACLYKMILKKFDKYRFSFIGGSLAGKKRIEDFSHLTGGSDDEQIIMFEKI